MVFARGGGTASPLVPFADAAGVPTCVAEMGAEGDAADEEETDCDTAGVGEDPAVAGAAGAGAASSGLIAGGVDVSSGEGSVSARVTITDSPASLAMPPASARASSRVIWRSAW